MDTFMAIVMLGIVFGVLGSFICENMNDKRRARENQERAKRFRKNKESLKLSYR